MDSYDLSVNNSHERLHRNKILQVIKKKHIEMFSKIAENKKDGEAVVISNERNSTPGRTSHSGFMEEGSCNEVKESNESQIEVIIQWKGKFISEVTWEEFITVPYVFSFHLEGKVHLLGWGVAKALVKFKKDDGSSFHYLPPCLIIHENGKTDEAVKLIMGAMEQVGGIYMVIGVVVADHGKTDGRRGHRREFGCHALILSTLRTRWFFWGRVLLCINFYHI